MAKENWEERDPGSAISLKPHFFSRSTQVVADNDDFMSGKGAVQNKFRYYLGIWEYGAPPPLGNFNLFYRTQVSLGVPIYGSGSLYVCMYV